MTSSPKLSQRSFYCPHCEALAHQTWLKFFGEFAQTVSPENMLSEQEQREEGRKNTLRTFGDPDVSLDLTPRDHYRPRVGKSFNVRLTVAALSNVFASKCFSCEELSVWVGERLVYPPVSVGVQPNQDLPYDIKADFNEARNIVALSPRGAAALLRLCVQKLCIHLGEQGKIDQMIGALVRKGLNPTVQQALDTVRVIGNEAVHPGEMDLSDDTETAEALFSLVNLIADQMISGPKAVNAMFSSLPEEKRKGIENRDRKNAQTEKA